MKKNLALLAVFGVFCFTSEARADIIIDNFNQATFAYPPAPGVTLNTVGSTTVTETGLAPFNTIGGVRESTLIGQSFDTADDLVGFRVSTITGRLIYSSSDGGNGALNEHYDGNGSGTGDLNADLTGYVAVRLMFTAFDFANGNPLPVTLTIDDGTTSQSITQSLTAGGAQTLKFNLSAFNAVDLTSVNSFNFLFEANTAHDFTVDVLDVEPVPEPASLSLMGFGLIGLVGYRWRRQIQTT